MYYNILYQTSTSIGYDVILTLNHNDLVKFTAKYENGKDDFFLNGKEFYIGNIKEIEIYDTSKLKEEFEQKDLIKLIENHLLENGGHSSIYRTVFKELGVDITNTKIKDKWGSKAKSLPILSGNKQLYVNQIRLEELKAINNTDFDLSKLIRLCEEVNSSYENGNLLAVGALVRAVLDHIPPVFESKTFDEVANNYKSKGDSKSFKDSMTHLNSSMRKITDSFLHSQIRKSETLPNDTTIDCKRDLDKLIGEIVRVLKK